jgi:two-component system chemotaxis response regulator CheY
LITQSQINARWILVAEDDDEIRGLITRTLHAEAEGLQLHIVEASDGMEALSKINTREFDCVVTDLKMPRASGTELMRSMQLTALNANTPRVIVTAAEPADLLEIAGHVKIINKPFEPVEVARAVLREVKLGRLDDRIASHLMNPFVAAAQKLLERDAQLRPELSTPFICKAGDLLTGDIHCNLILIAGLGRHRFTLSFDRSLLGELKLTYFKSRSSQAATMTVESCAKLFCQSILDEAMPDLKKQIGPTGRLASASVYNSQNLVEYQEMVKVQGLSVVIKTPAGRIVASAFVNPKPTLKIATKR